MHLSARVTNLSLFALVLAGVATGAGCLLAGASSGRWVFWLHSVGGFSIVVLLYWKRRIIAGSLLRRGFGSWAIPSLLLLLILLASLFSGILWSTTGLPSLAGESGLTLHATISVALAMLMLPHARAGWPRFPRRFSPGRRAFLAPVALFGAGLIFWRGSELASQAAGLSGAQRRFTGSRNAGSFTGNEFPSNAWLLDDPAPLDRATWRLQVRGSVRSSLELTLADLDMSKTLTATIDCTGGWFSTQHWQGAPLISLLTQAGLKREARSVTVRSATGYWRRFSIADVASMLLATSVEAQPLTHEHGAPLRLVAPGRRGYDWVKWVTAVEVSTTPAWWKWPLPVS
jgi:DMSO/TMAO reductase YedYZ molybdopterin-dependent catalytic subunit